MVLLPFISPTTEDTANLVGFLSKNRQRRWQSAAQRAMRPSSVVMPTPVFDDDFSLLNGHKYFAAQQNVMQLAVEARAITVFPMATPALLIYFTAKATGFAFQVGARKSSGTVI